MKLSLSFVAMLAAQSAEAFGKLPFGFKPPGMVKGTFSSNVAYSVDMATSGHSMGPCYPGGGGGTPGSGGGGGHGGGGSTPAPTFGWGTFQQVIDHNNPRKGTFSQRFWYSTQYWKGPGSPIILISPGEQSGTGFNDTFLTNQRISGLFGEKTTGAVVILEHRYWGESSPYPSLTVEHMQYLTVDQSLRDFTYFANNWVPPFDTSGKSKPQKAPWVLCGGSYAGALAGWEANLAAGQPEAVGHTSPFWAYYATSAVVQTVGDMWQYFEVVRGATAQNCSTDVINVIKYIDNILLHGTNAQKVALKSPFKLQDLNDADFARALAFGPTVFQASQFFMQSAWGFTPYYMFCDYIENMWDGSGNTNPGPGGVGVTKALAGYAKWFVEVPLPHLCEEFPYPDFQGTYNTQCLRNLNASSSMYLDLTPDNVIDRQYWWLLCNEPLAWFQDVAPAGTPSIVSKLVDYNYHVDICKAMFPAMAGGFGLQHGATTARFNSYTGGWSVPPSKTPRLLYTNGQVDPWQVVTVSSPYRPGGPLASSANVPVHIVPEGNHCSDVYGENWAVNAGVKAVADAEAAQILQWTNEFYSTKHITKPT